LAIAEKFHPDKIVLLGSYAYGNPGADSYVAMRTCLLAMDQATKIRNTVDFSSFAVDLSTPSIGRARAKPTGGKAH